jgi:hypothetical protein
MTARACRLLLCGVVTACGRDSSRPLDSSAARDVLVQTSTASGTVAAISDQKGSSPCPRTGKWALCSVEKRLQQAGFVVRPADGVAPRRAGFSVAPSAYTLGHARLEVFVYPDESALGRDIAGIDTLTASPRGRASVWETAPTFVRSANLAAVFLTDSPVQAERLTLAITAGAPQPNPGR